MDILAGMLAYGAGLGALLAGLAVSFAVFFGAPKEPLRAQPRTANAMLVRPTTPNKAARSEAHSKQSSAKKSASESGSPSERHATAPSSPVRAKAAAAGEPHLKAPASKSAESTQAQRQIQEQRARHWAYGQDSNFEHRFLGYSE